jgi:uncharacterized membrane protein
MASIKQAFLKGLQITVPILITFAILIWLLETVEQFFGLVIKLIIPVQYYIPGMGLLFGLSLMIFVGYVMYASFISRIYEYFEDKVKKIPGVKVIYGAIQDVMGFIDQSGAKEHGSTVLVEVLGDIKLLGFVTREDLDDLHIVDEGKVCVYCPMSYQIGGYTIFVSKNQLKPVDMNTQEAMSFIFTAGISKKKGSNA